MPHTRRPILRVFKIFQIVVAVIRGDILKSMALVLRANKLLAMTKDIGGFRLTIIGKVFLNLLIVPLSYSFGGRFKSTHPPSFWSIDHGRL